MKTGNSFTVNKSTYNLPIFWERKEERAVMKTVTLIATGDFTRKKALFINRTTKIPSSFHAMFVPKIGDVIIRAAQIGANKNKILCTLQGIVAIEPEMVATKDGGQREKFRIHLETLNEMVTYKELEECYGEAIDELLDACNEKIHSDEITSHFSTDLSALERINEKDIVTEE